MFSSFKQNKYSKWYFNLIMTRKIRIVENNKQYERHHILPKSMGGTDDKSNLVLLTPREHFLSHWLLTKIVEKQHKGKMLNALNKMRQSNPSQDNRIWSKWQFEIMRKAARDFAKGRKLSQETISKLKAWKRTEEYKAKISASLKLHKRTKEHGENIGKSIVKNKSMLGENNSMFGKNHTDEAKRKVSEANKGRDNKRWITNGTDNRRIGKNAQIPNNWKAGRTITSKRKS